MRLLNILNDLRKRDMTQKTTLLWDIGNVLISFEYTTAFKKLAEYLSPMTAMLLWAKKDEFLKDIRKELDLAETGRLTLEQLFSRLKGKIGLKMEFDQFKQVWCDIFDAKPDVLAYARELSMRYDCYFMSNTNREHYAYILETYPELAFVKGKALSFELGVMKPFPEFYTASLALFEKQPGECVFIDDNAANIAGALEAGIDGVQFVSLDQLQSGLGGLGVV